MRSMGNAIDHVIIHTFVKSKELPYVPIEEVVESKKFSLCHSILGRGMRGLFCARNEVDHKMLMGSNFEIINDQLVVYGNLKDQNLGNFINLITGHKDEVKGLFRMYYCPTTAKGSHGLKVAFVDERLMLLEIGNGNDWCLEIVGDKMNAVRVADCPWQKFRVLNAVKD